MKIYKFFANWCKSCITLNERLKNIDIPIESVDLDNATNINLVKKYNIIKIPTIIFVDDNGDVLKKLNGSITRDHLEDVYNKLTNN